METKFYLVGGAVRDELLNRQPNDKDYVVVGADREEMKKRGFKEVDGTNFRVFIDPDTKDEYALARIEHSTGPKHTDFEVETEGISLSQDLYRRDFTINAIAKNIETNEIIDPYGGQKDLENKVIRHVSDAFKQDPLRILRGARYAARFDFEIHEETKELMSNIASHIAQLPAERIGGEVKKAMGQADVPRKFFDVLKEVGALEYAAPQIHDLIGVPAGSPSHHKEGDSYEHTMLVLQAMYDKRKNDVPALLSAVAHDLGKARTPEETLPQHHGHDQRGVKPAKDLSSNYWKLSNNLQEAMYKASELHCKVSRIPEMRESKVIKMVDTYWDRERPADLSLLLDVVEADGRGKEPGWDNLDYRIVKRVDCAKDIIRDIDSEYVKNNFNVSGKAFGDVLLQERVEEFKKREDEQNE